MESISAVHFWQWVDSRTLEVGINSFNQLESEAGYAPGAIGKRRNSRKFPTVEMAIALCRVLKVSWSELWAKAGLITTSELENLKLDLEADSETKGLLKIWGMLDRMGRRGFIVMARSYYELWWKNDEEIISFENDDMWLINGEKIPSEDDFDENADKGTKASAAMGILKVGSRSSYVAGLALLKDEFEIDVMSNIRKLSEEQRKDVAAYILWRRSQNEPDLSLENSNENLPDVIDLKTQSTR